MNAKRGLLKGGKFSGSHTTLSETSAFVAGLLKDLPEVSKIVIGPITKTRPGTVRLKIFRVPAGLKLTVRSVNSAQVLFAYTNRPDETESYLSGRWRKRFS